MAFAPRCLRAKLRTPPAGIPAERLHQRRPGRQTAGLLAVKRAGRPESFSISGNGFHGYAIYEVAAGTTWPSAWQFPRLARSMATGTSLRRRNEFAMKNDFTVEAVWIDKPRETSSPFRPLGERTGQYRLGACRRPRSAKRHEGRKESHRSYFIVQQSGEMYVTIATGSDDSHVAGGG